MLDRVLNISLNQQSFTCSKLTTETLQKGVKFVQCFVQSNTVNAVSIYLSAVLTQPAFTFSKSTMETPDQFVKSAQRYQYVTDIILVSYC